MPRKASKYPDAAPLRALESAIRGQRKALGMAQEALAIDAGIERSYFGAVERGEVNLSFMLFVRIAEELRLTPSELLQKAGL